MRLRQVKLMAFGVGCYRQSVDLYPATEVKILSNAAPPATATRLAKSILSNDTMPAPRTATAVCAAVLIALSAA